MSLSAISCSVVIPHYGVAQPTFLLIEALRQQSFAGSLEVIVSDDYSPEPFPEVEGVRVVRRETNGGFGSAVNSGAEIATGKWLFILNSDLTISPDFIQRMVEKGEECGEVLISPQVVDNEGRGQWVGRKFPTTFHYGWEWFTVLARFRHTTWWQRAVGHDLNCITGKTVTPDWVIGACMMLPTQIFKDLGGFDQRFFMNCEEVDFQRRLAERGIPRVFAGDITVEHVGGGSSGENKQRRQWVTDARFIYAAKWNEQKHLKQVLTGISYLNYAVNKLREKRNPAVNAREILNYELSFVKGQP
ncbi:glycosyltransferase family 2 protein [Rothia terrae]|uniref:glycosyltransferase family 2 protein n=1 Tax=Rothia terrae TaxID=396015 RepID=UPI00340070CF